MNPNAPLDQQNQLDRIEFKLDRLEEFHLNGLWLTWAQYVEDFDDD